MNTLIEFTEDEIHDRLLRMMDGGDVDIDVVCHIILYRLENKEYNNVHRGFIVCDMGNNKELIDRFKIMCEVCELDFSIGDAGRKITINTMGTVYFYYHSHWVDASVILMRDNKLVLR